MEAKSFQQRNPPGEMAGVQAAKRQGVVSMAKNPAHTKWMCKYNLGFTPSNRRKIVNSAYKESLVAIINK